MHSSRIKPVVDALNAGDKKQAEMLMSKLAEPRIAAIADRLIRTRQPTETPAEDTGTEALVALTDFKASDVRVGWGKAAYDRVPDEQMLLESGGQFFATGIYAHAPARHVYDLNGKWSVITGHVGLAAGHDGTVEFEIVGDGKSLWKSGVVESSATAPFNVSIAGIQQLELLTHTTPDGAGADWGTWLSPNLTR